MKPLLNVLFPKVLTNHYTGYKISLYIFYLLTLVTLWRSQHHLLSTDGGAQSIATIPLDTFTQGGATAVIGVFALWGLSQLVIGLLYVVVAFRYRAMVPLMYLFMLLEYLIRAFYISFSKPIPTVGTAPGATGNLPMILLALTMLVLSIMTPKKKTT